MRRGPILGTLAGAGQRVTDPLAGLPEAEDYTGGPLSDRARGLLHRLGVVDDDTAAAVLADELAADPAYRWLFPTGEQLRLQDGDEAKLVGQVATDPHDGVEFVVTTAVIDQHDVSVLFDPHGGFHLYGPYTVLDPPPPCLQLQARRATDTEG